MNQPMKVGDLSFKRQLYTLKEDIIYIYVFKFCNVKVLIKE